MNVYTKLQVAVLAYVFGLLTGMVVAFASCAPEEPHPAQVGYVVR